MCGDSVEIKRAGVAAVDELAPLFDAYRQFYEQAADLAGARSFLAARLARGESIVFIARLAGEAVGFTQLYPFPSSVRLADQYVLNDLYVKPAVRGQGVATHLLQAAREFAGTEGAARLLLETAEDNPAQNLYEREGYELERGYLHYALML